MDQIRDPPGLVSSQGIHRIDQDRLDAPLGLGVLLSAVFEQRQQETLGFAGTGACGHQGVETSKLSYGFVDHNSNLGETLSGIGIYASGALEAVYVGGNLSMGQIAAMTQGIL